MAREGRLQGIVSERDLGGPKLPKTLGQFTVGDLMSTPVVTVTTRTLVRRAASLMKGRSIGSLVVTSGNSNVAGIVTVSDLLDYIARQPVRVTKKREVAKRRASKRRAWEETLP